MKVVWFTNTPSLPETYINNKPTGGGWIKSLEKAIQKKVELFVVFYHQVYKSFFKIALREKKILKQTRNVIGRTSWDKRVSKLLAPNATYFHNDEILRDIFYKANWSYKPDDMLQLFTTTGPYLYKGL